MLPAYRVGIAHAGNAPALELRRPGFVYRAEKAEKRGRKRLQSATAHEFNGEVNY